MMDKDFVIIMITGVAMYFLGLMNGYYSGEESGYDKAHQEILTETIVKQELLNKKIESLQEMIK